MSKHFKVIVIGAGTGGISFSASLSREIEAQSIAIIDPAEFHYYQPLWTLVGAGLESLGSTKRPVADLIPEGVNWIRNSVKEIQAAKNTLLLSDGEILTYDFLLVSPGLRLRWDKIEGLEGNLGKNGVCSIYHQDQVEYARDQILNFKKGNAVFVMPPVPIKCAGAPQKIMYLADRIFRNNNVRQDINIHWTTAGMAMFGIPTFSAPLTEIVKEKNIKPHYRHKIVGINAEKKEAYYDVTHEDNSVTRETVAYDLLHVVPPMSAPEFIEKSELAFQEGDQKGWLAVDKFTLQHLKYKNIFGLGDVTGVPNSKTGAAIRKQYPIVVANLLSVMNGMEPTEHYDGYSSCPLVVDIGKVILAEFGYDGKLMPTFPVDQSVPRASMWYLKRYLLPALYWNIMMKGRG